MEQCGVHEANLSSELDEETWQYLINELKAAYISDKELDTMMTHCWLPHITKEEPHCEKLTDVCQYSDISSDNMETDLEGKRLFHNIKSNVSKYKEFLQFYQASGNSTSHIDILSLRLMKEQVQHGDGDGPSQGNTKEGNKSSDPENEQEDNDNVAHQGDEGAKAGGNSAQLDTDYFFTLELKKTRSFKHKKHDIVNKHSYTMRIRDVITDPPPTLGEILPNLRAMFSSPLEEINLRYKPNDLVRIFIMHEEMVNTNIIVGPDFLKCITVDMIMDVIADVIRSNNFIQADKGLSLNVCAIKNIQGLNRVSINSVWKDLIKQLCIISVENDDNLSLPRAIGIALARCKFMENPSNMLLKRHYDSIRKKDRKRMHKYYTVSLQKQVAVQL